MRIVSSNTPHVREAERTRRRFMEYELGEEIKFDRPGATHIVTYEGYQPWGVSPMLCFTMENGKKVHSTDEMLSYQIKDFKTVKPGTKLKIIRGKDQEYSRGSFGKTFFIEEVVQPKAKPEPAKASVKSEPEKVSVKSEPVKPAAAVPVISAANVTPAPKRKSDEDFMMKDLRHRAETDPRIDESLRITDALEKETNPLLKDAKRRVAENERAQKEAKNGESRRWYPGEGGESVGFSTHSNPRQPV